jgi:hypothetical protein
VLEKEKGTSAFQVRILEANVEKTKVFVLLKFGGMMLPGIGELVAC